jgi:protein arginine kinase activator
MKCQRCPKPATLHITEVLPHDKFDELHLCEDCAKKHLYAGTGKKSSKGSGDVDDPGGKVCEACGLKFIEFRNSGRLGCPHDYDSFREELLPLLESIHGDVKHEGKSPRRLPKGKLDQNELGHLRRKLQQAVTEEAYEEAAKLRDRIKTLEES